MTADPKSRRQSTSTPQSPETITQPPRQREPGSMRMRQVKSWRSEGERVPAKEMQVIRGALLLSPKMQD